MGVRVPRITQERMAAMKTVNGFSCNQAAKVLGLSRQGTREFINDLMNKGALHRKGSGTSRNPYLFYWPGTEVQEIYCITPITEQCRKAVANHLKSKCQINRDIPIGRYYPLGNFA